MKRCKLDNCLGFICEFHSLRIAAQEYISKLEAVVDLVPHIHNSATCKVERKARATTYFDSHGPEPCPMCDALSDLEDDNE